MVCYSNDGVVIVEGVATAESGLVVVAALSRPMQLSEEAEQAGQGHRRAQP